VLGKKNEFASVGSCPLSEGESGRRFVAGRKGIRTDSGGSAEKKDKMSRSEGGEENHGVGGKSGETEFVEETQGSSPCLIEGQRKGA